MSPSDVYATLDQLVGLQPFSLFQPRTFSAILSDMHEQIRERYAGELGDYLAAQAQETMIVSARRGDSLQTIARIVGAVLPPEEPSP